MEKTISKKAQRNLNIMRTAIARGDSVSRAMKKLNLVLIVSCFLNIFFIFIIIHKNKD